MIPLIWDTFGEAELQLYEFIEDSEGAKLSKLCNGMMVNESGRSESEMNNLDKLQDLLQDNKTTLTPPFGPYSAIYISGFIP